MRETTLNIELAEIISNDTEYALYEGTRILDKQAVFFKVFKDIGNKERSLSRLRHEYDVMSGMNDACIPKVYGIENNGGMSGLVMESLRKMKTLRSILKQELELGFFFKIGLELSNTVASIHKKNIIHKGIKPENILIGFSKDDTGIYLIDFVNSSKLSSERQEIKSANALEMDLRYISPEQTGRMNRLVDWRTDLYSLGCVFYEMLTGIAPFIAEDAVGMVHAHIAVKAKPPCDVNTSIPVVLSDLVMKLLSKNAEDRYQSGYGLNVELKACFDEWMLSGKVERFLVGSLDVSEKFQIPQKLYGREAEVEYLMTRFAESAVGKAQLLLVGGFSGVGKSALINEVQKPMVERRGYFIQGKFDQFKRNIPFSAIVQAFSGLVKQFMSEPDSALQAWRERIIGAVGNNGQIIVDLLPSIELIIGKQPVLAELGPQESQNRFNYTMEKFVKCFTRPEHPLVLFLDDLQWADAATLGLLKTLMANAVDTSLLVIGAYRDNEVDASHPFMQTVGEIEKSGGTVATLKLKPLSVEDVTRLVGDTVKRSGEDVTELAAALHQKTEGNPFFVSETLQALYRKDVIQFDREGLRWSWTMDAVQSAEVSDNVVELMIGRLRELPNATQEVVKLASCMGNVFELGLLAIIAEQTESATQQALWTAVEDGLLLPIGEGYKFVVQEVEYSEAGEQAPTVQTEEVRYQFLHDRVQQAAYGLIEDEMRKEVHLKIGWLLLAKLSVAEIEERVFDVVRHLNEVELTGKGDEVRREVARLNALASERALAASAAEASLGYVVRSLESLGLYAWNTDYKLSTRLYEQGGRAAYLVGQYEEVQRYTSEGLKWVKGAEERMPFFELQILAFIGASKFDTAVKTGASALKELGVSLPEKSSILKLIQAIVGVKWVLRRGWPDLAKVPQAGILTEKKLKILVLLAAPIYFTSPHLVPVIGYMMVKISFKEGWCSFAAYGIVVFSIILQTVFKDREQSQIAGNFAKSLNEHFFDPKLAGRTIMLLILCVEWWKGNEKQIIDMAKQAEQLSQEAGDIEYVTYARNIGLHRTFIWARESIDESISLWKVAMNMSIQLKQQTSELAAQIYTYFYTILLGGDIGVDHLLDVLENEHLQLFQQKRTLKDNSYIYHVCLELASRFCRWKEAIRYAKEFEQVKEGSAASSVYFYGSYLSCIAWLGYAHEVDGDERKALLKKAKKSIKELKIWSRWSPKFFASKYALTNAEYAGLIGDHNKAKTLYEAAFRYAQTYELRNDIGLICERISSYFHRIGDIANAKQYLEKSCGAYEVWGAKGVVFSLARRYPDIFQKQPIREQKEHSGNDLLDMQSLMKASQTISGEIELEKLLSKLMTVVLEASGAEKSGLALWQDGIPLIQAEAATGKETVVMQSLPFEKCHTLPISLLQSVGRLQTAVILGDAATNSEFNNDVYIRAKQVKSVICLPIVNQSKLVGVLYVENTLTTDAFTEDRVQLLTMLSSQIAISIENANLYKNVKAVTEERSRIQTEMDVAQRIQTCLLPEVAGLNGYESLGYMQTADEVGGDYYDTIIGKDKQYAVIGDVSGHGVTSGLIMMMAQTSLHTIIRYGSEDTTADILAKANQTLASNILKLKEDKYMTMKLLELTPNGIVRYAGAHLDSVIYRKKTNSIEKLESNGFWLGMEDDIAPYLKEKENILYEGDLLLLYTDGVTEAIGKDRKLLGFERLSGIVKDNGNKRLEEIRDSILSTLKNYETPDDVTMLILRKK